MCGVWRVCAPGGSEGLPVVVLEPGAVGGGRAAVVPVVVLVLLLAGAAVEEFELEESGGLRAHESQLGAERDYLDCGGRVSLFHGVFRVGRVISDCPKRGVRKLCWKSHSSSLPLCMWFRFLPARRCGLRQCSFRTFCSRQRLSVGHPCIAAG